MPLTVHRGFSIGEDRSVHFSLHSPHSRTVRLVADFTQWTAAPLALQPTSSPDLWEVTTAPLSEGVHFYKYIVDGRWLHDPAHPMVENDGCGGWNSVFGIGGPSLGEPASLRIANLNLNTYQEEHALLKLEQTASGLAEMDVDALALQEVGEHIIDRGHPNAGEVVRGRLEELTGEKWYHLWRLAHPGFRVYHEGVSILSRVPLEDVREYRLSDGPLARNVVLATLTLKDLRVRLGSVHTSWPTAGGLQEIQQLLAQLQSEGDSVPLILAGGFNAESREEQIQQLLAHGFTDVVSEAGRGEVWPTAAGQRWQAGEAYEARSGFQPVSRFDYQWLRGPLKIEASVPIFNGRAVSNIYQPIVSDHIGILGVYRNPETA